MTGRNEQGNQGFSRPLVLGIETSCDETAAAVVAEDFVGPAVTD